jgi:hypothetical protein
MNETPVPCADCGKAIPKARLEVLPNTLYCVKCSAKQPAVLWHDPNDVCAVSSSTGRNGFAKND